MNYLATFTPQAWVNDNALTVDSEGPNAWDVTDTLKTVSQGDIESMLDGSHPDIDDLRDCPNAPAWIRSWSGPFCITVQPLAARTAELLLDHAPPGTARTRQELGLKIPDSDGRYGRGFRDALESVRLAMSAEGIAQDSIERAIGTALQAYGDNASEGEPRDEEIHEMLVVSIGHLTQDERDLFETQDVLCEGLIVSMRSEYAFLICLDADVDASTLLTSLSSDYSQGFVTCISHARELGVNYVVFERDGVQLEGASVYD